MPGTPALLAAPPPAARGKAQGRGGGASEGVERHKQRLGAGCAGGSIARAALSDSTCRRAGGSSVPAASATVRTSAKLALWLVPLAMVADVFNTFLCRLHGRPQLVGSCGGRGGCLGSGFCDRPPRTWPPASTGFACCS